KSGTVGVEQLSSLHFRRRGYGGNRVPMDSSKKGTARLGPADNPLGRTAPPCLSKTRRDKGRAPFEVNPAAKAWASPPALEALCHPKTNIVHGFPSLGR